MPIGISMEVTGIEDAQSKLSGISDFLDDMTPLAQELAEIVRDKHLNPLFLSEPSTLTGGPVHGDVYHAPLSAYTLRLHPHRATGQIHIDTGSLWRGAVAEGGGGNRYDVVGNEFTYELTDPRAPQLQALRPILFWHEELEKEITGAITRYWQERWEAKT